jgi:hypothetical protein
LILATLFLFDFMKDATYDLASALTLRGYDLEYFTPYDQFPLFDPHVTSYLDSIEIDT